MTTDDLEQHVNKILSTKLEYDKYGTGFVFRLSNYAQLVFDTFNNSNIISIASFTVIGKIDCEYIINSLYKSDELLIDTKYYYINDAYAIVIIPIDNVYNIYI